MVRNCCLVSVLLLASCESFLETDVPPTYVEQGVVFSDDLSATSAVRGLYVNFVGGESENFANGSSDCAATISGLSSDELTNYPDQIVYTQFEVNQIPADNSVNNQLWTSAYKTIYDANSIIEGLERTTSVTQVLKNQLLGEALFIRSFCHFYLVNLYGDVPLITTTDYKVNSKVKRTPVDLVYNQIETDLQEARSLLDEVYQGTGGRIRVNKSAATAFLARVQLYRENYQDAESMATIIIQNSSIYDLENLSNVFLANSKEAIWQLQTPESVWKIYTTREGRYFIIESGTDLQYHTLTQNFVDSFETGDQRRLNWVGEFGTAAGTVYFPKKYKVKYGSEPPVENSMVLRLAEQYLIRAEARVHLDKLPEAIGDVDMIRERAGLPLIQVIDPDISASELLIVIEQERRSELFTEGAHRWFDLKRTDRADDVLGAIKTGWNPEDELYPIPQTELQKNPNLKPQNPGY